MQELKIKTTFPVSITDKVYDHNKSYKKAISERGYAAMQDHILDEFDPIFKVLTLEEKLKKISELNSIIKAYGYRFSPIEMSKGVILVREKYLKVLKFLGIVKEIN